MMKLWNTIKTFKNEACLGAIITHGICMSKPATNCP